MDINKFKPINAYILIEEINMDEETKTGFTIISNENKKLFLGKVLKIGNGVKLATGVRTSFTVKPNDIVYFRKSLAMKFDEKHFIVFESDIAGILIEDTKEGKFISDIAIK